MAASLDGSFGGQTFLPPTPLDIATLEAAIVARLRSSISAIEVTHFPGEPANYRLTHRVGAALVAYRGARYGEVRDTVAIVQERILEFDVTLLIRDLGWSLGGSATGNRPGAYSILETIRASLTGFQIPGARKMYPTHERFAGRDHQGGVWIYATSFALSTIAVEQSPTDDFPIFVKGIADETGGESVVTIGAAPFTFDSNDEIQLPQRNIVAMAVSASGGLLYTPGVDYATDPVSGTIVRLPNGAIAAGATVEIAFSFADVTIASAAQTNPAG